MGLYKQSEFRTTSHPLGDGAWSIEVHLGDEFIRKFVGSNGTRYDEEADDLWADYREWVNGLPDDPDLSNPGIEGVVPGSTSSVQGRNNRRR